MDFLHMCVYIDLCVIADTVMYKTYNVSHIRKQEKKFLSDWGINYLLGGLSFINYLLSYIILLFFNLKGNIYCTWVVIWTLMAIFWTFVLILIHWYYLSTMTLNVFSMHLWHAIMQYKALLNNFIREGSLFTKGK